MTENGAKGIVRNQRRGRVVALTGAGTFLGRSLVGLLEEDPSVARIVVVDADNAPSAGDKTRFYDMDRTQPTTSARLAEVLEAEGVDVFVHLGFLELPSRQTAWAHELESVGTLHVLNACRAQRVKQFVLGSSTWLYGPHHDNPNFLTEQHALRGAQRASFLGDKIDAERQTQKFAEDHPDCDVTILRFGMLVGPTVDNLATRWLAGRIVPTLLGFDPLIQVLHEVDAVAALKLALDRAVPGIFNIVADGVLPISTVVRLIGRSPVPVPYTLLHRVSSLLWLTGAGYAPAPMSRFLKHLCVADGELAQRELGFEPGYTTREAVLELAATLRLRQANLLTEAYA